MSDILTDAGDSAAISLPDRLRQKFEDASKRDGMIDGQSPLFFLFNQLKSQGTFKSITDLMGNVWADVPAFLGSNAAMAVLVPGPGTLFAAINVIDNTRSVNLSLVNELTTPLNFTAADIYLGTGHVVSRPAVHDTAGKVTRRNQVIGRNPSGPGLGVFVFAKTTTLGVGFLGTDGAIHLKAEDNSLLPEGLFIGWRVPETGKNTCAISVNQYSDAKAFYDRWVNDNSARQTDASTNSGASVSAHCGISSLSEEQIEMVAVVQKI